MGPQKPEGVPGWRSAGEASLSGAGGDVTVCSLALVDEGPRRCLPIQATSRSTGLTKPVT